MGAYLPCTSPIFTDSRHVSHRHGLVASRRRQRGAGLGPGAVAAATPGMGREPHLAQRAAAVPAVHTHVARQRWRCSKHFFFAFKNFRLQIFGGFYVYRSVLEWFEIDNYVLNMREVPKILPRNPEVTFVRGTCRLEAPIPFLEHNLFCDPSSPNLAMWQNS